RFSKINFHISKRPMHSELLKQPWRARFQNEGSTLISILTWEKVRERGTPNILVFCAGEGGKSRVFQMIAGSTKPELCLWDQHRHALLEQTPKAPAPYPEFKILPHAVDWKNYQAYFNLVLCDVPGSRSGLARRHPELRWQSLQELTEPWREIQLDILNM